MYISHFIRLVPSRDICSDLEPVLSVWLLGSVPFDDKKRENSHLEHILCSATIIKVLRHSHSHESFVN